MKLINDLRRHTASVADEISAAIARVVDSGWLVLGPEVAAFEKEFSDYCGVESSVGVANGTEALELALKAAGVVPGKSVATVANAGGYSLHAILAVGAQPVFIDADADSMNMSPAGLRAALGAGTIHAVIFTHLYGNMDGIEDVHGICVRHGVPLIEDCAQSHGAVFKGRKAGAWGALGCFSFYPTKNLGALGDGGAVTTSDAGLASRLRQLRQYGWGSTKYVSELAGARNSRLDEIQAAVLRVKLKKLDAWNAGRRAIARRYAQGLGDLPLRLPKTAQAADSESDVAHLYVVRTGRRDALRRHLKDNGVGCDVHYPVPDHKQPTCPPSAACAQLPVTEKLAQEVLTLPCYPELEDAEVDAVISVVKEWIGRDA